MAIATDTLERWASYESAAISTAKDTHKHIRDRLEGSNSRLNDRGEMRFDTLLQGSYANATIIHGSSDVDVLVRMNNPYHSNLEDRLPRRLRERYRDEASYFDGDYSVSDFQKDVYGELEDIYGASAVTRYDKALVIDSDECQLQMDADVVPCQQHRVYTGFNGDQNDPDNYYRGIRFKTRDGMEVTSFPERHIDRGEDKNDECDGNYKETVRIVKNARDWLVKRDRLGEDVAPSYCVECLLYNVPSSKFRTGDLQERYADVVSHLDEASLRPFKAQNGIEPLFGRGETQWRSREALRFISELNQLWEDGAY